MTFAQKVIQFNCSLQLTTTMPAHIGIMNPFAENPYALAVSSAFYQKYYYDAKPRKIILGINPGRHGAGVTGIPFTDTKRLAEFCDMTIPYISTHEISSVFIYEVIQQYGGVQAFYNDIYINSISPLGFVIKDKNGREKNYNYYDSKALSKVLKLFIIESIRAQLSFGIDTHTCYCLGTGKNYAYLSALNEEMGFFENIIALEHPRYIMQYKSKQKQFYIDKYLEVLKG
ncbi:MAG: DUF4918 family protein [Flavobacteriaceae bacterium]|nr:DUF4918 family protein [Flavobacteriaceae bacterium]